MSAPLPVVGILSVTGVTFLATTLTDPSPLRAKLSLAEPEALKVSSAVAWARKKMPEELPAAVKVTWAVAVTTNFSCSTTLALWATT